MRDVSTAYQYYSLEPSADFVGATWTVEYCDMGFIQAFTGLYSRPYRPLQQITLETSTARFPVRGRWWLDRVVPATKTVTSDGSSREKRSEAAPVGLVVSMWQNYVFFYEIGRDL